MPTEMEQDATAVLRFVIDKQERVRPQFELLGDEAPFIAAGHEIQEGTGLTPRRINDAVALLENSGLVETQKWMGTTPFDFGEVEVTALGRFELQQAEAAAADGAETDDLPVSAIVRAAHPVGSPYGFTDQDWEFIEVTRRRTDYLHVVFGHQWESTHYSAERLQANLRQHFQTAVDQYNTEAGHEPTTLGFEALHAGYGEHLFNEIARQIIAADIAVFDTSDLNPNVMIEMGVALTWGVRVLPIRADGTPIPPSDISGQTWASYTDDGTVFADTAHELNLVAMVRRAMRKKSA
jgi:hypothetical protein